MYLNKKMQSIVNMLSQDSYFDNVKIIKAYPDVSKPTRLRQTVICVLPSEMDAENISVGNACLYGRYSVCIDAFVPQNFGSPCVQTVIEHVVDALKDEMPCGIKVSPIRVNHSLFCYSVSCCLTFCGEINFKGDDNDDNK